MAKGRKTKRTALKRFWKTGSGRVMRQKIGGSHYKLKKSKRRQRDLKRPTEAPRTYKKALRGLLD
ncbi:MAG: 50S ribosomal protein L35 [Armatimonadetes bacterium]|nr:50S ribosomal protein L35 [Armatimonadota bacterium]MDW8122628.1 bL35 family ribosomal protein [Armatimonadota bacterium]